MGSLFRTGRRRDHLGGLSLLLSGFLALSPGCVNQRGSRTIDTVYPLAPANPLPGPDARMRSVSISQIESPTLRRPRRPAPGGPTGCRHDKPAIPRRPER